MAYAILLEDKWRRAQEEAKATGKCAFEIYKRIGGRFVEGSNEEIEGLYKVAGIFDEIKKGRKKLGAAKKKKK